MRCVAFCTASSYKTNLIAEYLRNKQYKIKFYRNVLHAAPKQGKGDLFIFNHGCFVAWDFTARKEREIKLELDQFAVSPLDLLEISRFIFRYAAQTRIYTDERFNMDVITIESDEAQNIPLKLALSYGLAQSVKLESHEEAIQKTINNNNNIPRQIAVKGKISLPRIVIAKRIGEIFLERTSVNLNSEYMEVPEYFWEYPALESYYSMVEKFLDIPKRVSSLNRKLDVLHEMFDVLNNQLQHQYSSMLETVIILLILIEIILTLFFRT